MTMVERVARAIYDSNTPSKHAVEFDHLHPLSQKKFRKRARAAIEAMRLPDDLDPMDPVGEAVQTEVDIWPEDKPKPSPNFVQFVSHDEAIAIWNAGIDAALSEGDGK